MDSPYSIFGVKLLDFYLDRNSIRNICIVEYAIPRAKIHLEEFRIYGNVNDVVQRIVESARVQ